MARSPSSTIVQEELYPPASDAPGRERSDDSRLLDLEVEQESPFLRGQKRISVRRNALPKRTATRLKWIALAVFVFSILGVAGRALYRYGKHSWRFRVDSSDQIEVLGTQHVTHLQIMEVMGGDIGRNIFFVPLTQRKLQLEQIPWVESASVMRFVPNRLRVEIHERTPVAFARIGSHISLIDAGGTLMEFTPGGKRKYSFPVIAGMNAGEPLSTRAARMKNYNELVRQLDSGGARYSQGLSEVDLNDPEDVKVLVADPNGEVLVHLGSGNYLQRYKTYVTHVQQWRQQFDKLESVDLRYDGQIIVNPDLQGIVHQSPLTPAAAKAAMAAGVKPAAIVNYEKYVARPAPVPPARKPLPRRMKAWARPTHRRAPKARAANLPVTRTSTSLGHAAVPTDSGKASVVDKIKKAPAPVAAASTATTASQKKPSPGIPKENAQKQR